MRTKIFLGFLFGMILVGTIGGVITSTQWLMNTPSLPRAYWLLPLILFFVLFLFLFGAGSQVFRRRFAVYEDGFVPPYRRAGLARMVVSPFIPFAEVDQIVANTLAARGREIVYQVSVELRTGDRILIDASDIGGMQGVKALHDAWRDSPSRIPPRPIRTAPPAWIRKEWRWNLGFSLLLVATMIVTLPSWCSVSQGCPPGP